MHTENQTQSQVRLEGWEDEVFADFVSGDDDGATVEEVPAEQMDALKRALEKLTAEDAADEQPDEGEATIREGDADSAIQPAEMATIKSPDLTEAFLDDARRGIAALDQAVINYESNQDRDEATAQIERELHTLKGAASVVGLTDVGRYLHDVEDFIQEGTHPPDAIVEVLLDTLQTLRKQVAVLCPTEKKPVESQEAAARPPLIEAAAEGEDTISVKGEQLDRLLDMLTALTMLNNQRDTQVDQLRNINGNLAHAGNRIRDLERTLSKPGEQDQANPLLRSAGNPLREVANDLAEISKLLLDTYTPITQEHAAVSHFIRQFRTALVSILRMPVSGMFRRLQRSALDAARVERKQVRLEIVGSDAGLERSVQERLLDPLMHIVRNAVGHGIETPEVRKQKGKDPVGTITLEAISAPNLLTLNVRDDGRGLDFEALRRRGTELGLLQNGREATREELGQLIFHRGFSTRQQANEVAGRGVGMDVVADTLEKLHAWVEIESEPEQGTAIKLIVPLKSITEHALIVRVGGHLAAIPMQYVGTADDVGPTPDEHSPLAHALGITPTHGERAVISLEPSHTRGVAGDRTLGFTVDEILGPQEVVIRPLPPLLRHQRVLSGVTLSSDGRVVYVLEPRVLAQALQRLLTGELPTPTTAPHLASPEPSTKVMIVDDSLSVRVSVKRLCKELGWEAIEAADAITALELLEQEDCTAIVTDFDMPKMDGIQFVEALRAKQPTKNIPILMVTSRPQEELESAALEAGTTHFLSKPLSLETLQTFVQPQG